MTSPDRGFVVTSAVLGSSSRTPDTTSRHYLNNATVTADVQVEGHIPVSQVLLIVFALVMSMSIVFVNAATILVVRRTPSLHTLSNLYVVSLAATDLVVGLGLIPLSMFYVPSIRNQYFDRNMPLCLLVLGVNLGMAIVSTIHMAFIAIDRYMYITRPYIYETMISRKIIYTVLAGIWAFGVFYALLPQAIHTRAHEVTSCDITLVMPVGYLFYANVSIYTTSVAIDVAMYSQILLTAYRQRKIIQSKAIVVHRTPPINVFTTNLCQREHTAASLGDVQSVVTHGISVFRDSFKKEMDSETTPRSNSVSMAWRKPTHRLKSVKFFLTVFGVYFICLTPTVMCMGIDYYWPIPPFLYNMFNLLGLLNSGMNFIIYCALNARFRIALLKLFRYPKAMNLVEPTDASVMGY